MKRLSKHLFAALVLGLFAASCGGPGNGPESVDPDPLILSAGKPTFIADGEDEVHFTVTQGGEDVTGRTSICMAGEGGRCLLSSVYTCSEPGEYTFYAYITEDANKAAGDRLESNRVTVTAIEDQGPDPAGRFHKNVAMFTFTGAWCAPCYTFKGEMKKLMEKHGDGIVAVNFYTPDRNTDALVGTEEFYTYSDQMKGEGFDMNVVPTSFADLGTYVAGDTTGEELEMLYNSLAETPAPVGIKVNSARNGPYVDAVVSVAAGQADTYRIGVFLVEDNIVAPQMTDTGEYDDGYNHTNVHRATVAKDDIFGEEVGAMEAGDEISGEYRLTIMSKYNSQNLSLVVYVVYRKEGRWVVANSVKAPISGVTDYKYAE